MSDWLNKRATVAGLDRLRLAETVERAVSEALTSVLFAEPVPNTFVHLVCPRCEHATPSVDLSDITRWHGGESGVTACSQCGQRLGWTFALEAEP